MRHALQTKKLAALDHLRLAAIFNVGENAVFALQTFRRLPVEARRHSARDQRFAGIPFHRLRGDFGERLDDFDAMNFFQHDAAPIQRERRAKLQARSRRELPAILKFAPYHRVTVIVEMIHVNRLYPK